MNPTAPVIPAPQSAVADNEIMVAGQRFRYLEAGAGDTLLVLLHGWPQDASEWLKIIPALGAHHRVVAVDLPGIGGSTSMSRDFSKATLARELRGFVQSLNARRVFVIGHDIGAMIAYAYARQFETEIAGAILLDAPLPGLGSWDDIETLPEAWHFRFHAQHPLAEQLVADRQAQYFRYFIDGMAETPQAIPDTDVDRYAAAYRSPDQLSAGFGFYRAFPQDKEFNSGRREPTMVPLLIMGGSGSLGEETSILAKALIDAGMSEVEPAVIEECGHWLPEERPEQTADLILRFVGKTIRTRQRLL